MGLYDSNINVIYPTGSGSNDFKTTLLTTPTRPPTTTAPPPADPGIIAGINPLDVAAATYGKVIPIVVGGCPRIGGYIIYGPKFTTVSGLSYVSFGVSFGFQADPDGERELWEIRMDGVKVWTLEDGALIDGLTFRFTEGTEVQEPDAMLVADYGAAAPAFRSQCCLFFQNLPIARFDNHIPFVSAVLADVTDGADPSDGILLGDALERLASSAFVGLDSDQFETVGITTIVLGLIEAERGSFIDLLQRLARLFPLDIVQTDKLRVIERSSIAADIVLNTNRIVGGPGAVQIQLQTETDVAQELEFIYIDIDRDYEFTPQKGRRPSDPVAITASRAKETINLPVVTDASNALSWVTLRKYYDEVARKSVSFTALPYGMEIDPGTMVAVKIDLGTYVVRVAETLHEARGTVKCTGTPVLRCSVSVIDDGPEIGDVEDEDFNIMFVAAGESAPTLLIWTADNDGTGWATQTSDPATGSYWNDSCDLDNALFVIVGTDVAGTGPIISTSPNGVAWTPQSLPIADAYMYGVNCDGPLIVASGGDLSASPQEGLVLTSADGATWVQRAVPSAAGDIGVEITATAYDGSQYVACGTDYYTGSYVPVIISSSNGITWVAQTPPALLNGRLLYMAYGGGIFVIVGEYYAGGTFSLTSTDGVAWTEHAILADSKLWAIRYADGVFVAVGEEVSAGGIILTSTNGVAWTSRSVSASNSVFYDVSFNGGTWVAVGTNNVTHVPPIVTSPEAIVWTPETPASSPADLITVVGR